MLMRSCEGMVGDWFGAVPIGEVDGSDKRKQLYDLSGHVED